MTKDYRAHSRNVLLVLYWRPRALSYATEALKSAHCQKGVLENQISKKIWSKKSKGRVFPRNPRYWRDQPGVNTANIYGSVVADVLLPVLQSKKLRIFFFCTIVLVTNYGCSYWLVKFYLIGARRVLFFSKTFWVLLILKALKGDSKPYIIQLVTVLSPFLL